MRTYKSYFALILIPYLILIISFHTQLQSYDNHSDLFKKDERTNNDRIDAGDTPSHIRKVKAIHHNLTLENQGQAIKIHHDTHPPIRLDSTRAVVQTIDYQFREKPKHKIVKVGLTIVHGDRVMSPQSESSNDIYNISRSDGMFVLPDAMWKVPPTDGKNNYALPFVPDCHILHKKVKTIEFQKLVGNFIYSAFYDTRIDGEARVRIFTLLKKLDRPQFFCHFGETVNNHTRHYTYAPEYYEMCENHGKTFGGWILSCAVPAHFSHPPCSVIISTRSQHKFHRPQIDVSVPVFSLSKVFQEEKKKFGICIPPLFGYIPSTTLVEFIELSRLIGADELIFYAFQTSRNIQHVLRHYEKLGMVTVIPWNPPIQSKSIWYYGQLLAINDCLYRNMNRFKYLSFNDIDEFIVPHGVGGKNWTNMVTALNRLTNHDRQKSNHDEPHCGFIFQSAFFDPLVNEGGGTLYNLESDLRSKTFSRVRTKVMVQPDKIFELGIHHISRPINIGYKPLYVPVSHGYLHHYRKCTTDYDHKMNCQVFVRDESISSYTPELRHNVHLTLWNLRTEFL